MSDRDDLAADMLADRDPTWCRGCAGLGWQTDEHSVDRECPDCGGTGEWEGWPA